MWNIIIIIILILIVIWFLYNLSHVLVVDFLTSRRKICNNLDGRCYPIVDIFDKNTLNEASNKLAYLNGFSIKILRHMRNKYLWNSRGEETYRGRMTRKLLNNYDPDSIIENNPSSDKNTSYVEDKGKVYALCLREKESGKHNFHDNNILEFVVLHEMSHMSTDVVGHDEDEFWINFKILLHEAKELGLHNPVNYSEYPISYCSLYVDYNPFFDDTLDTPY